MLQTREFVNNEQPIYKIGRTQQPLLKRFNQYPKGSLLIIHVNVKNSVLLEKEIISVFSNQFTCKKNLGHEYFEGDISKMKIALFKICCQEEETQNDTENEIEETQNEEQNVSGDESENDEENNEEDDEENNEEDDEEDDSEIKKTFPNFNDDIVFNGKKQLVKFSTFDELNMKIDTIFINTYKSIDNYEIDPSYDLGTIGVNYIKKLLQNGCFNFDEICDLKDKPLMRKMHSCKKQIKNVMLYEYPEETPTKSTYDQIKIFFDDTKLTTINEKVYYADNITSDEELYDNTSHQQWFHLYIKGECDYKSITIVKMKHFNIDIKLLRKLLPYKIEYNGDSKIGYIINRDYEFIDCFNQDHELIESHDIKSIDFDFGDNIEDDYLFNDNNKPWENLKNTKLLFHRFTEYIRLHNITIKNITKTENLFNKILM
jgi:hypothetical protein